MEKIRINFWVDESLYYAIKGKLLAHKIATRERITITDICTEALKRFAGDEIAVREYIKN